MRLNRGVPSTAWQRTPAVALTLAVLLIAVGLMMAVALEQRYRQGKIDEATEQARILAATVTAALSFRDRAAAQEYVNALAANPDIEVGIVFDEQGAPFVWYSRNPDWQPPSRAPPAGARFANDRVTVDAPVTQRDQQLGSVHLRSVTESLASRMLRYGAIGLLVLMAALLLAVLGVAQAALARANAELASRAEELSGTNARLRSQIEQREQAEAALRQAQKMEAIGQLTGGVAHDFNNLLQVVLGSLDRLRTLARRGGGFRAGDSDFDRLTEAAIRAGQRAAVLTQRLLAFSRRQPLAPKTLDINKLVVGMSDLLIRTLGESVRTETVLAGGLWRVQADENQLENALLNLAVNARDAMKGSGKLTIETANAWLDDLYARSEGDVQPGQYVMVAVSDTGEGMSEEVLARAFDPFFTTKDVGQGTGLGLSQVYGFAKQSGGHVKIYSEPGDGTTVKLYLPRLPATGETEDAEAPVQPAPTAINRETILVVEDEEDVRLSTVETLRDLGYTVLHASDGTSALKLLEQQPLVRLLFTDVGLPGGLNGRQLSEAVRKLRPGLAVLFTTGYARNAIVHHGRLDPGVRLIAKPFSARELAFKVREALDGAPTG